MANSDTILTLGFLGIAGYAAYVLLKPVQKTVSDVGSGVSEAVGGTGSAIKTVTTETAETIKAPADFFQSIFNTLTSWVNKLKPSTQNNSKVTAGDTSFYKTAITGGATTPINTKSSVTSQNFVSDLLRGVSSALNPLTQTFTTVAKSVFVPQPVISALKPQMQNTISVSVPSKKQAEESVRQTAEFKAAKAYAQLKKKQWGIK